MKTISILIVLFLFNNTYANKGEVTGLDLPRYVSLKSNEANIRIGPSKNYPILLKYIVSDYPLQIIDEYNDWRKVEDFQNNIGWIHKSLLTGQRNGIIISYNKEENIDIYNTAEGKNVGSISTGSIVLLSKCKPEWCLIIKNNYRGWVKKKYIWGTKKNEIFNVGYFEFLFDYYFRSLNFIERYISQMKKEI